MSLESYIPFVLATLLILIIPGPTIILVISQAMANGPKSVLPLVVGVVLGDFTAMTLSLLGLGAILSTSAFLFSIFKWIGALYLFYIGIKLWISPPQAKAVRNNIQNPAPLQLLRRSYIVTALNPKGIAFFVAFLPQFINPAEAVLPQLGLLGGTFLLLALLNATVYALFAGQLSKFIQQEKVRKWFNRCGGGALIGAGIVTAGLHQTS